MINRVSSYFPKGGHSAKNNINTLKVKHLRNSDTKLLGANFEGHTKQRCTLMLNVDSVGSPFTYSFYFTINIFISYL